jgi:Mrp family chromosome partitioning ATPase
MLDANVVVTHCDPKSPVSEAYRVLRTNIQYSGVDKPMKTIVVTSSGPVEGKTTTIVNLAVTFAQAGCRVLLIDSDMRKPKLHKVFVIPNTKGLTNLLIEHGDYRDYVQDCDVPNLEILTCGTIPHNPSELLSSRTMRELLEKVNANILGVVLNQLDRNVGSNYYYYHDYYYGEDGKTKGKRKSIKRGSRTSKPDTGAIKAGSLFQNEPEM